MFWLCGGGGRKDKTRKDFVAAVAGFDQGNADNGAIRDSTSSTQQQQHQQQQQPRYEAVAEYDNAGYGQQNPPPPCPEESTRNTAGGEKRPPSPPKASESTKTPFSSEQQSSMPMLVSPEESGYFESVTDDGTVASQRPEWINNSYSQHVPNLTFSETQTKLDSEARGWEDDRSVRPGWITEMESVAAQSERPGWINDAESVDVQSERPGWINGIPSLHSQTERALWMEDTESVDAQSQRPGWMDETNSVAAQSQRPGWMNDAESVTAQSVRPGWMDEAGSVDAQSVRPGWMDETGSVDARSVRPGWVNDTESESVGLRPGSGLDRQDSARPGWMGDRARSQRPAWSEGAPAPSMGGLQGSLSPKTTLEHRSTSPEVTRGGQSSSEGAARPLSELTESPKGVANHVTAQTPPGSRFADHSDGGGSVRSDEGGLLGLIIDTNEKEATRRKNRKLRHAEQARRAYKSSPAKGVSREKETDDCRKQQTPRQGTAEPAKVRIIRSKTMPTADSVPTTAARSGTPISHPRGALPPPSSTIKRLDRSGSEDGTLAGKRVVSSESPSTKGPRPSPRRRRTSSESASDTLPPKVVIISTSPRRSQPTRRKGRKPGKPKPSTDGSSRKWHTGEGRPRRSSESSSTSSADSKNNESAQRRERPSGVSGGVSLQSDDVGPVSAYTEQPRDTIQALAPAKVAESEQPRIWNNKDDPAAAADAALASEAAAFVDAAPAAALSPRQDETAQPTVTKDQGARNEARDARAAPLSKPIVSGRRGRSPHFKGTPGQRKTTRNPSRTRMRITSDLPPLEEEVGIPTSPVTVVRTRGHGIVPEFALAREDKNNQPQPGSAKDIAARQLAEKLGNAWRHGAPTHHQDISDRQANAIATGLKSIAPSATPFSDHLVEVDGANVAGKNETQEGEVGDDTTTLSDKDEAAKVWLARRSRPLASAPSREDSFRRRGSSQRLSRSSSWDDGSSSSFHGPQAMFSPGRFNPTSGALSWGGSVDDSWCEGSVRSAMTAGTRNSSSASVVSARWPSDRKVAPPQLSKREKSTVDRLKIKRSDVHFGYRTVGGSARVYKIELNGEMRAAKVINTLGMNKEEMSEVLDTFDVELLALSRLRSPHIVQVHGASVSPAEIIVVSEFVEGGVLRRLLDDPRKLKHLTKRIRLGIAKDTALGMKSLYAHGMQHRHLSSNSILLTSDYRAKILGVGLAMTNELISFFTGDDRTEEEVENELPWASREVLAGAGFSEKSDVYSFGIVLWEIMQKDPSLPYAGMLPSEVVGAKYNGEGPPIPKDCPPAISKLMESCWSNLPADRPSFEKICQVLDAICL